MQHTDQYQSANYLVRHWRGELSLPVSYWVNGVLANLLLMVTLFGTAYVISSIKTDYAALLYWIVAMLLMSVACVWQSVGIWRSAGYYANQGGRRIWSLLARLAVILGVINLLNVYQATFIPALRESVEFAEWLSDVDWTIEVSDDGSEVEVRGGIKHGIAKDFEAALSANPGLEVVHVNLHQGGVIAEARRMQQMIRDRQLTTYVSGECVSACTLVFLGGTTRLLKTYGRIGFHAYSIPGIRTEDMAYQNDSQDLIRLGVDAAFAEQVFAIPKDDMWYPDVEELLEANVIHEVVEGSGFRLTGTSYDASTRQFEALDEKMATMAAAETVQETLETIETSNAQARAATRALVEKARSAPSVRFVEAHKEQNQLAFQAQQLMREIADIEASMAALDLENPDTAELEQLDQYLTDLCVIVRDYIPLVEGIVAALDTKIALAGNPDVLRELFQGDPRIRQVFRKVRDNQAEVLKGERKAFLELECRRRLHDG